VLFSQETSRKIMNHYSDQYKAIANTPVSHGAKARRFSVPLIAMAALLTLAGCSNGQNEANDTVSQEATTGDVLRIGTEGAYAPFNYTNADGTLGGFDVEIANAICADMEVTCDITAQEVSFTEPYFSNTLVFLAKKDSSFDPSDSSDINAHSIAAQRSTISSQWLENTYPKANMKLYDTLSNAFLDLGSNRVDAMVSDKLPALEWLGTSAGSNYALKGEEIDINDNFAIAVRPGDALQEKINQSLANIKADGTYDEIHQKYFAVPKLDSTVNTQTTEKTAE
jgi:putative lysine/arginine/ornithine/histidine/octopine transport system substrate-binding protein